MHLGYLGLVERRVQEMGNPLFIRDETPDCIHLILHKCNQRRNHYGRSVHHKRGKLITQRLSAARRHQHEGIAAAHEIHYYVFLLVLELIETEELL